MDESVGRRVARLAKEKYGWSSAQLAKEAGVSYETLRKWKTSETAPSRRRAEALAALLAVTAEFVMFGTEDGPDSTGGLAGNAARVAGSIRLVPLVSWVNAGAPPDSLDPQMLHAETWLPCPVDHSAMTIALRVTGDSMLNPGGKPSYSDGEIIYVDPMRKPRPGDRVVVRLHGRAEATFKQLVVEDGQRQLKALNPDWRPRYVELDDADVIVGVVIGRWIPE